MLLMGKSIISMAIFNCYVSSPEGIMEKTIYKWMIIMGISIHETIKLYMKLSFNQHWIVEYKYIYIYTATTFKYMDF